jgi:flagellar basal-body rod modification protein FlgD
MSIAALEPIYSKIPEQSSKSEDDLGMNQFLTMLVAQLKNQDPLNPLDGTDFTAQLAQFSGLEQQFKMNEYLADIHEAISAREKGNILDYIGKTIKTYDNTICLNEGQMDSSSYELEHAASVTFTIYNEDGVEVRKIYEGWQDAGEHDLDWDGRDNAGAMVDDGVYTVEVEARDEEGSLVRCNAYVTGEVTGITYVSGSPYLMIGNKVVSPDNIVEVGESGG